VYRFMIGIMSPYPQNNVPAVTRFGDRGLDTLLMLALEAKCSQKPLPFDEYLI
jgi:hypothetical protein